MRHPDWLDRLWKTLEAAEGRAFFFGACVDLCVQCVDAMTGSDWASSIKPLYEDEHAARALVAEPGTLERLVTERLGDHLPLGLARRGDVVSLHFETGPAIGICVGARIACAAERGILYVPIRLGLKCWHIE